MSSQDKIQTDNKGKGREETPKPSGSGSLARVHPDEQEPAKGAVSLQNPSTLSTPPPLHQANENVSKWLTNAQKPSEAGNPSIQNQENAQLPNDSGSRILAELSQGLDTLAERSFNRKRKTGTSAPANTPQSCDFNGLRPRAQSEGDAIGRRLRMGPQANTMDGNIVLPPFLSTSSSSTRAGTSAPTPQNHQTFTAADIIKHNFPHLPSRSAIRALRSHTSAGGTEGGLSASPKKAVLLNLDYATGEPALAGIASNAHPHQSNPLSTAQPLELAPFISSTLAGTVDDVDGLAPVPSNLNGDAQQPASELLAENVFGMPPTPTIRAQQASHFPIIPPQAAPLVRVTTESESFHDNSTSPFPSFHDSSVASFLNFSSIGRQHSPQASTVRWMTRPKSRGGRIMQDLRQLCRDCFRRLPAIEMTAVEVDRDNFNRLNSYSVNEHRDGSQIADIFERTGHQSTENAYIGSLDGQLRGDVASGPSGLPKEDPAVLRDGCNQSHETSETAREAGNDSDAPVDIHDPPKNFLQRWKAKRAAKKAAAARAKATM